MQQRYVWVMIEIFTDWKFCLQTFCGNLHLWIYWKEDYFMFWDFEGVWWNWNLFGDEHIWILRVGIALNGECCVRAINKVLGSNLMWYLVKFLIVLNKSLLIYEKRTFALILPTSLIKIEFKINRRRLKKCCQIN